MGVLLLVLEAWSGLGERSMHGMANRRPIWHKPVIHGDLELPLHFLAEPSTWQG